MYYSNNLNAPPVPPGQMIPPGPTAPPGPMAPTAPNAAYEEYIRILKKETDANIRILEDYLKGVNAANKEVNVFEAKKIIAERHAEKRKASYWFVSLNDRGEVILDKKNALIDLGSRSVTNMIRPHMRRIVRLDSDGDFCYRLDCLVDGKERRLYLEPSKITNKSYLEMKLSQIGAFIKGEGKKALPEIMALFIQEGGEDLIVSDSPGWYLDAENHLIFFGENDLTWKEVQKLCK